MFDTIYTDKIKQIVDGGALVIPSGKGADKKEPYISWRNLDKGSIGYLNLMDMLVNHSTETVCIVLGTPSNGLVCIDVDDKYERGINGILRKDLEGIYPEIWDKIRVESTKNGGLHLFFGAPLDGDMPKNGKIASRYSTDEEIAVNPKEKTKCFIEIKGEGGLCQCYPSPGYELIKGIGIGNGADGGSGVFGRLTKEEYVDLVTLLSSYTKVVKKEDVGVKVASNVSDFYSENPYEHFDKSQEGSEILEKEGWKRIGSASGGRIYYCRPGKTTGVSASFNSGSGLYTIFTASAEVDPKSYTPSNLLCSMVYGGDKKELYSVLVSKGYGKIKDAVERRIAKNAAKFKRPLPTNISEKGKEIYEEEKESIKSEYPHGVFWDVLESGTVEISQRGVEESMISMGYCYFRGILYKKDGCFLVSVTDSEMFTDVAQYIVSEQKIYDAYSRFVAKYYKLCIERVREYSKVVEECVIQSGKHESYKFFSNCYILITKDSVEEMDYGEIEVGRYVVKSWVKEREYKNEEVREDGLYRDYLNKTLGYDDYLLRSIGYLAHDYLDDSMNSIIIGLEKCEDSKNGGGSGKNLFFNILNHTTSVHVIPGSQAELDRNLLQSFNGERIVVLSDVKENFDVSFFKDFSSGAATLKKLYKDVIVLKRNEMPKPVILTNFSYKMQPGLERRVIDLEFSEFFSRIRGGVAEHYGMMFPSYDSSGDWNASEWLQFDNIIVRAIQTFLLAGKLAPRHISETGWNKQFKQNYTHLYDFIEISLENWIGLGFVSNDAFIIEYEKYRKENTINKGYSSFYINKAIEDYCLEKGVKFNKSAVERNGFVSVRGRSFIKVGSIANEDKSMEGYSEYLDSVETKQKNIEDVPF